MHKQENKKIHQKNSFRFLNQDGSTNIKRKKSFTDTSDLYHRFLAASHFEFTTAIVVIYILINIIFGLIYFLIGPSQMSGLRSQNTIDFLIECFFFSVQTFSTIGYGHISPIGLIANIIVSIQALAGISSIAIMSGLFFARFSRATARVVFSKVALLTQHEGQSVFMFRIANRRMNQIIDAHVSLVLAHDVVTAEGNKIRKLTDLIVARQKTPVFALSWTVYHVIAESSPFYKITLEQLNEMNAEILVLVSGNDETFNQFVHSRFSYAAEDILVGAHFEDILIRDHNGHISVKVDWISKVKA